MILIILVRNENRNKAQFQHYFIYALKCLIAVYYGKLVHLYIVII